MAEEDNEIVMKIEEAILYVLAELNGGLRTEQIADIINRRKLLLRKDGQPETVAPEDILEQLHLQIRQEEVFLRNTFGTEYEEYCKKVHLIH